MKFEDVKKKLDEFAEFTIAKARKNLEAEGKGSGQLSKSLDYEKDVEKDAFIVTFLMEEYGMFVDKGVKGADPSKVSPNAKITGQQAPKSPFKFGSGTSKGTWKTFTQKMAEFAKSKNIRFRDKKGRFAKGGYQSMGYVIAKNIYNRGLKPTFFFDNAFDTALKKYADELLDAYALDVENEIILGIKK
jgi:hypothetical protein